MSQIRQHFPFLMEYQLRERIRKEWMQTRPADNTHHNEHNYSKHGKYIPSLIKGNINLNELPYRYMYMYSYTCTCTCITCYTCNNDDCIKLSNAKIM